jgi:hypothetical protein
MAKGAAQAQDLEKVTDYHEEAEVDAASFQKVVIFLVPFKIIIIVYYFIFIFIYILNHQSNSFVFMDM